MGPILWNRALATATPTYLNIMLSHLGRQPPHPARREWEAKPKRGAADAAVVRASHPEGVPRVEDPRRHRQQAGAGRRHAEGPRRGK